MAGAEVRVEAALFHAQCSGKPYCPGVKWKAGAGEKGSQTVQALPAAPKETVNRKRSGC